MKKSKLTKIISSLLAVAFVLALNPIGASAEWRQNSTGWWYSEGSSWATGWKQIDGNRYYFNSNGYMAKNTIVDNYYINGEGEGTALVSNDLPIKIPVNWTKVSDKAYATTKGSVFVYDARDTFGGAENDIIQGMKEQIVDNSSDIKTIEKNYNGHNATCFEYLYNYNSTVKKTYMVIIFSNQKSHAFIMTSDFENYESDKQQLEDILNLTLTL